MTIKPGRIGVNMGEPWWVVVSCYIHSLPKGENPNPDLVAAAVSFHQDPAFTETALFRARRAGNESPYIEVIAASCAVLELRLDDGLAHGLYAMNHAPEEARFGLAPVMHEAALASFKLKVALDLETQFESLKPPANTDYSGALARTIQDYEAMPKRSFANPIYVIDKLPVRDVTSAMESLMPADEEYGSGSKEAAASFRKDRRSDFSLPSGHYHLYRHGPTGKNVDFSAHCRFKDTDQDQTPFAKCIKIGLTEKGSKQMLISLVLSTNGVLVASGLQMPPCKLDVQQLLKDEFDLRMVAVGNRCELTVNGTTVFYGPILADERTRELNLLIQHVGVTGEWRDVSWRTAPAREEKR